MERVGKSLQKIKGIRTNEEGVITIWLSMLLFIMLVFVGTMIECVRVEHTKSYSKMNLQLATESVMADYDPNVYEHYHIFLLNLDEIGSLENRVKKYAESSFYNDKLLMMKFNKVDSIKLSYVSSNKESYIKEQIKKYMKYHSSNKDEKTVLVEYLMQNFSSYGDTAPNSSMKKNKIYELEYIIAGKNEDNDNVKEVTNNIENFDAMKCSDAEYQGYIKGMLMALSSEKLIDRACELIEKNISNSYGTKLNFNNCAKEIEVTASFRIADKFAIKKVSNYDFKATAKMTY